MSVLLCSEWFGKAQREGEIVHLFSARTQSSPQTEGQPWITFFQKGSAMIYCGLPLFSVVF